MFLMGCSPTDSMINRIGFIGNYLPRQCDIATFTTDLWEAIAAEYGGTTCIALPINDLKQATPIRPASRADWSRSTAIAWFRFDDKLTSDRGRRLECY